MTLHYTRQDILGVIETSVDYGEQSLAVIAEAGQAIDRARELEMQRYLWRERCSGSAGDVASGPCD